MIKLLNMGKKIITIKETNKITKAKKVLLILFAILLTILFFIGLFILSLPDVSDLKTKNPKTTSIIEMRIRSAKKAGKKLKILQKWVDFKIIPEMLKNTIRLSEDAGFYYHEGIDYYELKEAIKKNLKEGKKVRGGSTITQQLAKNLYLSTDKSYYRKIKEFFIAKKLEKKLSKDRIFVLYLNLIEFGSGIFGVEAASEFFFKKPVNQLNLTEIIRLAAVIPKPLRVSPLSDSRYLHWRANLLLDRLYKYKYISDKNYFKTKKEFKR
jgi:monofunctional biosynthetic peptidoglycan transglycosylase